jgi:hypothetical protein
MGSRASRLRTSTTSVAYVRTLTRAHAGATRSRWRGPCCGLRKVVAWAITKGTGWCSAPTMKMITGAEVGRRRGAQRLNQTPRGSSSTFHSLQSLDDHRALRGRLAGLVAKGTPKVTPSPSPSSPLSFSVTLNKTKAAAEVEKVHR